MVNGVITVILVGYAYILKMPGGEIIPLVLTAILASISVALPATFYVCGGAGCKGSGKAGRSSHAPLRGRRSGQYRGPVHR
jgi:H+-transporting ATPase